MSGHNGTSASRLARRFNFSWDVITTRRNPSSFTNAYGKPITFQGPESGYENCHNFDAKTMGGICTRLGNSSQHLERPKSSSLPELPGAGSNVSPVLQAPRKTQTPKHNSPMMPTSRLSARCERVYAKYEGPLYYTYEKN